MLGSGSRLIGSQLALVWVQLCHLFVPQLWWWGHSRPGPRPSNDSSRFTTNVQFHYNHVCAINFIRSAADAGVIELWLEQMMENRAVKFFDGHIFGGRWPGYYDRDYKWWRSSSKLHFSLYLDHSGCLDQGRP